MTCSTTFPLSLKSTAASACFCLQIGGGWFSEQRGGLNRYFFDLVNHLPRAGVRCRALVAGSADEWADKPAHVRPFAKLKAPLLQRWVAERRMVAEELAQNAFDVAAVHFAPYAWPVVRQLKAAVPLVVHFHGPWALESQQEGGGKISVAAKRYIEKNVYRRADRLITLSEAFAGLLSKQYGIARERIEVVPGGVDCARFNVAETSSEARVRLGWPTSRPIVVAVRRLVRRMGLENLIDAVAVLRKKIPDVLLFIGGQGPLKAELQSRIDGLGIGANVQLLGFIADDDLPLTYRAADISIVPTVALEGFGLIAAESLAAGTPVLVTPVGGLPEVVAGLDPDLIMKDATPETLAASLENSLLHPGRLPSAAACRDYAQQEFDWTIVATRLRNCYNSAKKD